VLQKGGPRGERVGEARGIAVAVPRVESDGLRTFGDVGRIPVALPSALEQPVTVDAAVVVEVADRHHDPAVAYLVFGAAVRRAGGPVRVVGVQVDSVPDNLVDGAPERPEQRVDGSAQSVPARGVLPDADVGDEEPNPRLDVTRVDRHPVADRQLSDGQPALDGAEAGLERIRGHVTAA
jgi:hypothetical protein